MTSSFKVSFINKTSVFQPNQSATASTRRYVTIPETAFGRFWSPPQNLDSTDRW